MRKCDLSFELRKRAIMADIRELFVDSTDADSAMLAMDALRQYAEELRDDARDSSAGTQSV